MFKQRDNKGERWVASRTLVHPLTRASTGLLLLLMPARPWARSRHPDRHPGSTALACMHAGTAHTRTILFFLGRGACRPVIRGRDLPLGTGWWWTGQEQEPVRGGWPHHSSCRPPGQRGAEGRPSQGLSGADGLKCASRPASRATGRENPRPKSAQLGRRPKNCSSATGTVQTYRGCSLPSARPP